MPTSKRFEDKLVDYVMQDVIPADQVKKAAMDSVKDKSGAGIGEKPLHNQLKQKLQETGSPLVNKEEAAPIVDEQLEAEEEAFYEGQPDMPEGPAKKEQLSADEARLQRGIPKGFKDALTHFGPRLAALLIGGSRALEGYESGMQSFQQATEPDTADMDYQQVEELRDEKGRPMTFSKKTGKFYNVEGKETTVFTDPKMAQIKETQKTDLAKARSDFKTNIVKEFNSTIAESEKAISAARGALKLIQSNSKIAAPIAARAILRGAGEKGKYTDKDVEQVMGSNAIPDSLKRVYQRAVDGTMTDEDKKVMSDAINTMTQVEAELIGTTKNDMAERYGAVDENLAKKEDILKILKTSYDTEASSTPQAAPKLGANQVVKMDPRTKKKYIVDTSSNTVIGEYK